MPDETEARGRLPSRGAIRVEDFCAATGLDHATVVRLMREGKLAGALWRDKESTRPFGLIDDQLPSRQALLALGLRVRPDYGPADHRSFTTDDHEDDAEAGS